jgi:hypothetical protein
MSQSKCIVEEGESSSHFLKNRAYCTELHLIPQQNGSSGRFLTGMAELTTSNEGCSLKASRTDETWMLELVLHL